MSERRQLRSFFYEILQNSDLFMTAYSTGDNFFQELVDSLITQRPLMRSTNNFINTKYSSYRYGYGYCCWCSLCQNAMLRLHMSILLRRQRSGSHHLSDLKWLCRHYNTKPLPQSFNISVTRQEMIKFTKINMTKFWN